MTEEKNEEVFIDFRAVARGLIYDTGVADPECHAEYIGLSPISDEGSEMERKLSDSRLDKIDPVDDLLKNHAALISGIMTSLHYNLPHLSEEQLTPEVQISAGRMMPLYAAVAVVSSATFLSLLLENGIVQFTAKDIKALEFNRE